MPDDAVWMRRAIALSAEAASSGNLPFGAVLVSAGGEELLAADEARSVHEGFWHTGP